MAKAKKKIEGRGGPNRGQGRKPKYTGETVAIRVPVKALPEIEELLKKYASGK